MVFRHSPPIIVVTCTVRDGGSWSAEGGDGGVVEAAIVVRGRESDSG